MGLIIVPRQSISRPLQDIYRAFPLLSVIDIAILVSCDQRYGVAAPATSMELGAFE